MSARRILLGRIKAIDEILTDPNNAVAYKRLELSYNAAHQYDQITRYASAGTGDLVATTDYTYDDTERGKRGRVQSCSARLLL